PAVHPFPTRRSSDLIQMDVMRSTGAGGQSVNTTDSAVRLTHKPSGLVVKCQQEKSQLKNRAMALKMLRTKLYEMELERQQSARRSEEHTSELQSPDH